MPRLACSEYPPFRELRNAAGEFDVFQAARDFAHGVRHGLAVFERDQLRNAAAVGVDQFAQLEHDFGAARKGVARHSAKARLAEATA